MSAQIITALRKRADVLDAEAEQADAGAHGHVAEPWRPDLAADMRRFAAAEFRALADEAEAP